MRLSPRFGFRIVLVIVAVALLWYRLLPHHHARPAATGAVTGAAPAASNDLSVTSPLNQPGGGPVPADAYAIYSALYQAPMNEPLVFSQNSITDIPQVGTSCLKPSTQEERDLSDAFTVANRQSHPWEQKFSIPQGYSVLAPSAVSAAESCLAAHDHTSAQCAPYAQIRHVRFLGVPGLDRTQTHALVSVIQDCGADCGGGGIFEVEKSGNTWQRSAPSDFTSDCSWIY